MNRHDDKLELQYAPIEILMVEDDAIDSALARSAMNDSKIVNRLYVVRSVREAKEYLESDRRKPDMVLVDLQISGLGDGFEVLECDHIKDLVIVAMSRKDDEEIRDLCAQKGVDGFIPKPITGHKLRVLIEESPKLAIAIVKRLERMVAVV